MALAAFVAPVALALSIAFAAPSAVAQDVKPVPGTVVAAELDLGQISLIDATGKVTVLVKNLKKPNGVAAMADGSLVIAESGANRVVGIGGRFGPELKPLAQLEFPQGLAVGLDGTVYVTLLLKGEVGKIDLTTGAYTKIAGDLKGPGDVAIRNGLLYVTEGALDANDVVEIHQPDGAKTVVASGFQQPVGVATGPGKVLFVSDYKAGKVVKVDDTGAQTDFVKLDQPVQLAIEPYQPLPDLPYAVIVASKAGVARYDVNGKKIGATTPLRVATGVATVPASETPLPTTTVPSTTTPAIVPTTLGSIPPTTRLRATTTTGVLVDADATTTSGNALTLSLLIIGVVGVAVVAFLIVRKPKGMSAAGFEERSLDSHSVAEAFGPCAAQEVELAEAEGGLQSLIIQQETAEKRSADAIERIGVAEARLAAATAALQAAQEAGGAGEGPSVSVRRSLELDDLGLTTDGGRAALAEFAKGEIDAHALEARWTDLGEQQAIEVVRATGEADAATVDLPEPVRVAQAEVADAREELETAEMDRDHANFEIPRLQERLDQATARITEARASLEMCQADHRADEDRKARAIAEAAAVAGQLATAGDDVSPAGEGASAVGHPVEVDVATADPAAPDGADATAEDGVGPADEAGDTGKVAPTATGQTSEPDPTHEPGRTSRAGSTGGVGASDDEAARQSAAALAAADRETATRGAAQAAELEAAQLEARARDAKVEQDASDARAAREASEAREAHERKQQAAQLAADAQVAKELAEAEAAREAAQARDAERRRIEAARLAREAAEDAAREAEVAKAAQQAAEAKAAAAAEARAARLAEQSRQEDEARRVHAAAQAREVEAARLAEVVSVAPVDETPVESALLPPPASALDGTTAILPSRDVRANRFDSAINAMFDSALPDEPAKGATTTSPDATVALFGDADGADQHDRKDRRPD